MDLFARVTKKSAGDGPSRPPPTTQRAPDAALSRRPRHRVRALLHEMQTRASWGEKEHAPEEQRLLQALQMCVVDAPSRDALAKLPKRMCAYEFKPGDIAWNCRVCQVGTVGGPMGCGYG